MASSPEIQYGDHISSIKNNIDNSDPVYQATRPDLEIDPTDVRSDNMFNLELFNKKYEDVRKRRQKRIKEIEEEKLARLNRLKHKKKLHQFTVGEHMFNMKDALLGTLNDILRLNITIKTFTKQNRLFYLGLFTLITILIITLFSKKDRYKMNFYKFSPNIIA